MIAAPAPSIAFWQHAAALALVAVDIAARGARSAVLLPVRLTQAMTVNCCGDAIAAITPARAGGDPTRYVWFVQSGISRPLVVASFATENALNTVVLGCGGVLLLFFSAGAMSLLIRQVVRDATTPDGLRLVAAACGVGAVLALVVHRQYPHLTRRLVEFLRGTWRAFRTQPRDAVVRAGVWTVVSMIARTAVLPVLVAAMPDIDLSRLIIGSVLILYALLLSPTPGGLGPIEAGFFAGLHGVMDKRQIGVLLATWRAYAWIGSAAVGAVLLLRARLGGTRRSPA